MWERRNSMFSVLDTNLWQEAKTCIKYRKHWKSDVSFQLSGQIRLIWAVRNYSPQWHQFSHERSITIYKLIFKKLHKSEKAGLPRFQMYVRKKDFHVFCTWYKSLTRSKPFYFLSRKEPKNVIEKVKWHPLEFTT